MKEIIINPNKPDKKAIKEAAAAIRKGKIVAFPTDTIYGLGVSIYNELAMRQTYRVKGRLRSKALIALIADLRQLDELVTHVPPVASRLIEAFWPGALTLILPAKENIPAAATKNNSIGVRLPNHPVALELIRAAGIPLATTSANRSGFTSPTHPDLVRSALGKKIDLLLDGGLIVDGVESTIVDVTAEPPKVLRQGAIAVGVIRKVLKAG